MKHNIKRYTCVGILLSDQLWVPPEKYTPGFLAPDWPSEYALN
jgi:hypothetical protein